MPRITSTAAHNLEDLLVACSSKRHLILWQYIRLGEQGRRAAAGKGNNGNDKADNSDEKLYIVIFHKKTIFGGEKIGEDH